MTDHAFLAPSSAHIWGPDGCAYYPTMAAQQPPQDDTIEKREGTAAHHLLAQRLMGNLLAKVGDLDEAGTPITAEMFECTDDFVRDVEALRLAYPDLEERVESRVDMPMVHPTANWGTADWFAISRTARKVWLKDEKFGHRFVDAWENWQLSDYLLGVIREFQIVDSAEWTADLSIYQPRNFHPDGPVRTWSVEGSKFRDLSARLASAAAEAMGANPKMRTGDHCGDCEGRIDCPAYRRSNENGIDLSLQGVPEEMDAGARGTFRTQIATAIKRLEGMATGLDADIEASIRGGTHVPGWELKPGQPRLAWTAPMPELLSLHQMLGASLFKEEMLGDEKIYHSPITPAQAIKNGVDEAVIMEYAKRPPAGLKVAQSEKSSAAKAFK